MHRDRENTLREEADACFHHVVVWKDRMNSGNEEAIDLAVAQPRNGAKRQTLGGRTQERGSDHLVVVQEPRDLGAE